MSGELARARIDWLAAKVFWLGLDRRSYGTVARQFGVSDTRVRFVARRDNWQAEADAVDAEAAKRVQAKIVRSREERVSQSLRIVDKFLDRFDAEAAGMELKPSDMPHLVKLAELLVGEATDRMSFAEVQEALGAVISLALDELPAASKEAFLAKVRERLGAIGEADAA